LRYGQEIVRLAREILSDDRYSEALQVSAMLGGSMKEKKYARIALLDLTQPPPKRPLYYLHHEAGWLPEITRDFIKYLGDYVDLLTKALRLEVIGPRRINSSLGVTARTLDGIGRLRELADYLTRYNDLIYVRAKHDFRISAGQRHTFSSSEAVWAAYITFELANRIKSVSKLAEIGAKRDTICLLDGRPDGIDDFLKSTCRSQGRNGIL
jgi:hypothetical protein